MADIQSEPGAPVTFFDRQDKARRATLVLEFYFGIAVAVIASLMGIFVMMLVSFESEKKSPHPVYWDPKVVLIAAIVTVLFILCGCMIKLMELSGGGRTVAELLGGQLIQSNTTNLAERRLLNIVEEMSIASGTPLPQVFVLANENSINALAAGHSTRDMAICVTRGALRRLNRDELQGVIGHEFSHILNGDMNLNMRLMGLTFGIMSIAYIGRLMLETRDRKGNLVIPGLVFLGLGFLGVFFAEMIKSAICRQREFLADASAVQFTRNAMGLANALKKVGASRWAIFSPHADDASHMFFADGVADSFWHWFATHPPLAERIRALDPTWDGKFIDSFVKEAEPEETDAAKAEAPDPGAPVYTRPLPAITTATLLGAAGRVEPKHLEYAADVRAQIPGPLLEAVREPMSAVALVYAMLLVEDKAGRQAQLQLIESPVGQGMAREAANLFEELSGYDHRARLPLASLAVNSLRQLSPEQFAQFENNLDSLIEADKQIDLFEFTLQKLVRRQLEPHFGKPAKTVIEYYVLKPLALDCALVISALARLGQSDSAQAEKAFLQGAGRLNLGLLPFAQISACGVTEVGKALDRLNQTSPQLKKLILQACAETVAADGVIQQGEAELLCGIAETLDCPIPRFLAI